MRALLLGAAGGLGSRVASELARNERVEGLILAGRRDRALARLATLLGGSEAGMVTFSVDAAHVDELAEACERADILVSCAGPAHLFEARAARAAIEARIPYVSACDEHPSVAQVLELDADARSTGVTVVSGCGFSPGLTNMLVALAANELDAADEIDVSIAGSTVDSASTAWIGNLLSVLAERGPFISDHAQSTELAGTAPKLVYFPEPVGWVETFHSGHPEVLTLPRTHGELSSLRFRVGIAERAMMDLMRIAVRSGTSRTEKARRRWLSAARSLGPLLEHIPPRGPSWTAARVDVRGSKEGRTATVSLGAVDHLLSLASLPLVFAAEQLGTGDIGAPGVHAPDDIFDPASFFGGLAERGVRIARLEPYPV